MYRRAFHEALRGGDDKVLTSVFINLMELVNGAGTLDSLKTEIELFGRQQRLSPLFRYATLFRDGIIACYGQKDYRRALDCFGRMTESIGPMERQDSVRYVLAARSKAMQTCYLQGDPEAAVGQMKAIEAEARLWGMHDVTTDACRALWQYYEEAGLQSEADAYRLRYLEAKDSLLTEQRLERMADLRFLNQLERAGSEMRLLSYRHRMELWSIAGLCVFIVLLLAVMGLMTYNYHFRPIRLKSSGKACKSPENFVSLHHEIQIPIAKTGQFRLNPQRPLQDIRTPAARLCPARCKIFARRCKSA